MNGLHAALDEIVADVPEYGDLDRAIEQAVREQRRRTGLVAGLVAAAAVVAVVATTLAVARDDDAAPQPVHPTPTPTETETPRPPTIQRGPSDVLAARQVGRSRLEVGGRVVPGRWELAQSRHDVWVAAFFDDVGYMSPALWWGKGRTTHEVKGQRGGYAISQDARWIAWVRSQAGLYSSTDPPWVLEVVDTATGKVRWSRTGSDYAPEIAVLSVTDDGVVVFGHCLAPSTDVIGTPQCDAARIEAWEPRSGTTRPVPAQVTEEHGPPGTVTALTPQVEVTGADNGLLVRSSPDGRPTYVHVSADGDVQAVATLPRNTWMVTADERFALVQCEKCAPTVLSLETGTRRPLALPPGVTGPPFDAYDFPVAPYLAERGDLVLVRALDGGHRALARCSLEQARCVRVRN